MLFSGFIYTWQSWEAVFYWMGSLPVIWCLLWAWLVQDDSTAQCYITEKERILIQKSLGGIDTSHKVSNLCSCLFILISHVNSVHMRKRCDCKISMNVHAFSPHDYESLASTMLDGWTDFIHIQYSKVCPA
jgi:hypothetical protein